MANAAALGTETRKYQTTWLQQVGILFRRQWLLVAGSLDYFPFVQVF